MSSIHLVVISVIICMSGLRARLSRA
jgi:hypothetical protein